MRFGGVLAGHGQMADELICRDCTVGYDTYPSCVVWSESMLPPDNLRLD